MSLVSNAKQKKQKLIKFYLMNVEIREIQIENVMPTKPMHLPRIKST